MIDRLIRIITFTLITVIALFLAQEVILHSPISLIITILWSLVMVLYLKNRAIEVDPNIDPYREEETDRDTYNTFKKHKEGEDTS